MDSLIFWLAILVLIVIPMMVFHRRNKVKKEEAELREQAAKAAIRDATLAGAKAMRERVVPSAAPPKRNFSVVSNSRTNIKTDDVKSLDDNAPLNNYWMFGAGAVADSAFDQDMEQKKADKFEGGGGTFDGGGASGDWDNSSRRDTSYDPSPSYDSSSSSCSDSSSSSSDSGSSSSSD